MAEEFIWITRWEEFQHYKLERGKRPVWIKDYTRQLDQDRYRELSLHQRGLLASLRQAFSKSGARLRLDRSKLSARVGARIYQRDLDALNHAGFIELVSRETIDDRLDKLYSRSRQEREREEEPPNPHSSKTNSKAKSRFACHICGIEHRTKDKLADHLRNVHDLEAAEV